MDIAWQGANPESSLCQDQQKHDKSAMTWHQNAQQRLYISILKEERIRMSIKPELKISGPRFIWGQIREVQVSGVIEISFNYFLLGGETGDRRQGQYSDQGSGDEVPRCLGSPSISGPARWWGHYNRIGHAGTTLGGGPSSTTCTCTTVA